MPNRTLKPFLLPLLFLLLLCVPSYAQSAEDKRSARIDALFARYDQDDQPGCAVLVIKDGKILHAKGYGTADLERKVSMGPGITTPLGSVGKRFTAMAVMILHDQGKLDFDDPATKYIPELKARFGEKITVRHLLNHTSGLPDYHVAPDQFPEGKMPTNEDGAAALAKWGKPRFAPGERHEYSNPGYEMLGLIAERVSKKSFAAFMAEVHRGGPNEPGRYPAQGIHRLHFPALPRCRRGCRPATRSPRSPFPPK